MIGNPSKRDFKNMVRGNLINNCPGTSDDITNARAIFSPDLANLRGKTIWQMPALVVGDYVSVPKMVVECNKIVTLAANVFFVDGIAFLLNVLRQIKFITAEHVASCMAKSLSKHLARVVQVYRRAGFSVHTILMDREFEKVEAEISNLVCNTTATKEHFSKAECSIRTLKEWTRGIACMLPFQYIPQQLKIEFMYFVVLWLNMFPVKTGISGVYSPCELLVRWYLDYKKHCCVLPGMYCKVHNEPIPSNTMTPHTHWGIVCSPTGNLQGNVKFYCLKTGRILKRWSFTPLPMPDSVIKQVNQIGLHKKQGAGI